MYTTINESGLLNNYAKEPAMYLASFPTLEQQQRYMLQGGLAALFVVTLIGIAFGVS